MHIVLGAILGAAAVAALQAIAVAYLVGLLVAALVVAGVPVLLASVVVPRDPKRHWLRRPVGLGALLGLGAAGAVALSLALLQPDANGDISFVLPYVPGLVALPIDLVLLLVLAVRGARRARTAVTGADLRGGAQSLGLMAGRALMRGVAVVIHGAVALAVCGSVAIMVGDGARDAPVGAFVMMDVLAVVFGGGLGGLFAWWGRAR